MSEIEKIDLKTGLSFPVVNTNSEKNPSSWGFWTDTTCGTNFARDLVHYLRPRHVFFAEGAHYHLHCR